MDKVEVKGNIINQNNVIVSADGEGGLFIRYESHQDHVDIQKNHNGA